MRPLVAGTVAYSDQIRRIGRQSVVVMVAKCLQTVHLPVAGVGYFAQSCQKDRQIVAEVVDSWAVRDFRIDQSAVTALTCRTIHLLAEAATQRNLESSEMGDFRSEEKRTEAKSHDNTSECTATTLCLRRRICAQIVKELLLRWQKLEVKNSQALLRK
jgi:hypothetical protein